jgi:uncharacterized membrane protein YsdA (DUF1294 family)
MALQQALIGIVILLNIVSFAVMAHDKRKSVSGADSDRTPEGLLFFMAACFGSVGVYAGMLAFRHKTRKWYFQVAVPLLILQNAATLYVAWQFYSLN